MQILPPANKPWNYRFLALTFSAGLFFQLCVASACAREPFWPWPIVFAAFDVMILGRIAIALWKKEVGRTWVFYGALCVIFVPLMGLVDFLCRR
jgi:hypothetical protein